jgi:hypothetical protein
VGGGLGIGIGSIFGVDSFYWHGRKYLSRLGRKENLKTICTVTTAQQNDNPRAQGQHQYTFIAIDAGLVVGYSCLARGKLRVVLITYWYNLVIGN